MISKFLLRYALAAAALAAICGCSREETAPIPPPSEPPAQVETGAIPPPASPVVPIDRVRGLDTLDVTTLQLNDYTILLGRTMMVDVARTLGVGVLDERGDGADRMSWYCYTLAGRARIWLISAEMGTGDLVTHVRAVRDPSAAAERRCPALPARFARIAIYPETWLGSPAAHLTRQYDPLDADAPWTLYTRERHISSDNLEIDERSQLAVRMENGRVVELHASKVQIY